MSIIDDLFGGGREAAGRDWAHGIGQGIDAAKAGEKGAEGAFGPYSSSAGDILNQYRQALAQGQDPSALLNQYMKNYHMSGAAQAQLAQGQKGANQASAASGMLGSGAAMKAAAAQSEAVRGQDQQNYLNHLFGIRSQYLQGMGGLEGQGFRSAEDIARMRNQLGQGEMGAYGQMGKARGAEDMGRAAGMSGAMGAGLGIAGALFGGPMGGMIGSHIGGGLGNYGRSYIPSIPKF